MRRILFFLLLFSTRAHTQNALPPLGMWREELPYQGTIDVTASDKKIYAATEYSLFSVDRTTREVERISRVSGLAETGISTLQYDPTTQKLWIAYANSNMDVIDAAGIHNMPDLKRKTVSGDKGINQIYPQGNTCYVSTGLGVIVVDADKFEIKDSWFIGQNGNFVKTYAFTQGNGFFYAATEEGLKATPLTTSNPADFNNWQTLSGSRGLPAAACKTVVGFQNRIVALENDSLFLYNGSEWKLFFAGNWPVVSIQVSGDKLVVCQKRTSGAAQAVVLNADGLVLTTLGPSRVIADPKKGISLSDAYWVADQLGGLSEWSGNQLVETYKLNSPDNLALGQTLVYHHVYYAAAGTVNDAWNYQYNPNGLFRFSDGYWTSYNRYHFSQLDSLLDLITVAVDPRDESIWAGSFGGGLLHIRNHDQMILYKQNSPLEPALGDPGSYRVAGLAFDSGHNLWISNFGASHFLQVLKSDSTWKSFAPPFFLNGNAASAILIDDLDQKWIASPLGNGLIVFNDHHTINDPGDDQWKQYTLGAGNGNLPSAEVTALARDKNGFIWVGTTNGVAVVQCPQEVFHNPGCDALLPVIREDAFANYLFKGTTVRSIAVDGANRKWMATPEGAWLISEDGDRVLQHFTEENSPLLSTSVRSIAIDGATGEVYFATDKGICSYRGTATEALEEKGQVTVFPNPVPPGYAGTIAVKGLPENSFVKITELDGRLVYQARSLGGQLIWNGRDYRGRRASTGIYLVMAEDDTKQEKALAKIVFIGR
ncbi:MAG: type IX secretion system anionic LPS delivery protein PorZ [Flavisolibacter sp.]